MHGSVDYRAVFEQAPSLFLLLTPDLRIVDASDAYLNATMTRREDIVGRGLFEVFPDNPDDPTADGTANLAASLERVRHDRVADTMAIQKYDVQRPLDEGGGFEQRWWCPVNIPVLDERGRLEVIVHRVEDVTELEQLRFSAVRDEARAADLEETRCSLEAALFRRTHELEEAMLHVRQADQMKSDFLSRMSHELRTPLNAVLGFTQLLAMDDLTTDQQESVERILRAGRHLLELINEVLDIARIESGNLSLSIEPLDAQELVAAAVDLVAPMAAARGITVDVVGPGDLHLVADRQRTLQILLNLLSNAVKYNREHGRVVVELCADGGRIAIAVSDEGAGVPAGRRDQIFAPFERLGMEQTDIEGSGVGLTLSRHLAHHLDGELGLTATGPGGSTFTLELPATAAPVPDLARVEGVGRDRDGAAAPGSATVLYIEDNVPNVQLLHALASRLPATTMLTAMQGRLGLELAAHHRPDLVLLDIHLPDLSGDEVLAQLRGDPATADLRIVVLSADATPGRIERLLAAGADGYLTKPFDVRELIALIDSVRHPVA